jgi:hypothetical protein
MVHTVVFVGSQRIVLISGVWVKDINNLWVINIFGLGAAILWAPQDAVKRSIKRQTATEKEASRRRVYWEVKQQYFCRIP